MNVLSQARVRQEKVRVQKRIARTACDRTTGAMTRLLGALALLFFCALRLAADSFAVENISDCGSIDGKRTVPPFVIRHERGRARPPNSNYFEFDLSVQFTGYPRLSLLTYFDTKTNWDYVSERKLAAGWLKGAPDLLLLAWGDESDSHGTGHYVQRHHVVVRMTARSLSRLLQRGCVSSARMRDASHGYGIGSHFFAMEDGMLVDTLTCFRDLWAEEHEPRWPLYHPQKWDGTEKLVANISEKVIHRFRYRNGTLKNAGVELWYTSQPRDTFREITHFYFGPVAPISVLVAANLRLASQVTSNRPESAGWESLPEKSRVKIPLPEEWITKFYLE